MWTPCCEAQLGSPLCTLVPAWGLSGAAGYQPTPTVFGILWIRCRPSVHPTVGPSLANVGNPQSAHWDLSGPHSVNYRFTRPTGTRAHVGSVYSGPTWALWGHVCLMCQHFNGKGCLMANVQHLNINLLKSC